VIPSAKTFTPKQGQYLAFTRLPAGPQLVWEDTILPTESVAEFDKLHKDLISELVPNGAL
jgi:hypothetical protein